MRLSRRLLAAVMDFFLRVAPPRPITGADLGRADFSTHPGGRGLRFNQRLRDAFRRRWLRLWR
jgi:hypothetical protein